MAGLISRFRLTARDPWTFLVNNRPVLCRWFVCHGIAAAGLIEGCKIP
jgi:hypothetical protein